GRGLTRRSLSPRALGRQRLSGRDRRNRDSPGGADLRGRGLARRDDERPPLPPGDELGGRPARDPCRVEAAVRPGRRRVVRAPRAFASLDPARVRRPRGVVLLISWWWLCRRGR